MFPRYSQAGAAAFALALAAALPGAYAQSAVDGAIGGTVTDTSGAVVGNAKIVIHNNGTNAEITVTADGSGFFRATNLQPGTYNVTITGPGFETYHSTNAVVQVGAFTTIDAHLQVGSSAQTVEVSGQAPLVNTESPEIAEVVPQSAIQNVPENNYRWSAFALLTPGVVNDSNGYGLLSFRGQSTLLNNITIDGTDDNQAFFSEERGRTRAGYSTIKEAVQEFQVNTSNYSVEYGRSAGGIVNSVTKSGSNAFHGSGYYYDRDSQWAAINPTVFHPVQTASGAYVAELFKPTDLRRQYGLTFGGPILKDRLFFFLAADRFYHYFPGAATITAASANANFYNPADATLPGSKACGGTGAAAPSYQDANVCAIVTDTGLSYANAYTQYNAGIAGLRSELGTVPRTGDQTIYFPKLDWQVDQRNHVAVEGNVMHWTSPGGIQTSPAVADGVASFGNDYVRDTWIVGKLDTLVTPSMSNEVRYMYGRDFEFEDNQTPTAYEQSTLLNNSGGYTNPLGLPPEVSLSGFFAFGTPDYLNRAAYPDERRWQLADTYDWQRGNHDIKIGEDYIHTDDRLSNLYAQYGYFSYSGNTALGSYIADSYLASQSMAAQHYQYFFQGTGDPGLDFTTSDYAAFIQDQWKASRRLSITAGLRWEYEQLPSPQIPNPLLPQSQHFPNDTLNIGPRVGFAYDVRGDGQTVLRGGYGMFFAREINASIYQALIATGSASAQSDPNIYPTTTTGACAISFPQVVTPANQAACLGGAGGNAAVDYLDPNYNVPEIHQADLTLQQQLGKDDVISVSWLGTYGRRLPDFVDTNLPAPTPVTFTVNGTVPNGLPNGSTFIANAFLGKRPNKNFSTVTDIFSGVTSNYEAAVWQYAHRFSHYLSANANYTWSHSLDYGVNDTAGTSANALLDPTNLRLDYGNSIQNVPSRLVLYTVADLPFHVHGPLGYLLNDYEIAPDFQAQTGLPYSLGINGDSSLTVAGGAPVTLTNTASFNGSGGSNRVPVSVRNAFQQPRINVLDLRLSKRIVYRDRYNLEFFGEAFNLANHQNVTSVGTSAYTPTAVKLANGTYQNQLIPYTSTPFQSVTAVNNDNFAYSQRQLQLGARLHF